MTISGFAAAAGVTVRTIERWLAAGKVTPNHRTLGGHARFSRAQLAAIGATANAPLLSTADFAAALDVSVHVVNHWVGTGRLAPPVRPPGGRGKKFT